CGGFPCQPFSTASRGRRVAFDFWPEMYRVVGELRPEYVIAENVSEAAIAHAAECLRGLGYRTHVRRISADDAGADHTRNRWWLVAHPHDEGELHRAVDAEVAGLQALCRGLWGPANYARAIRVPDGVPDRVDRTVAL
ncbi:DNA cytosine methyltransferase, partial [Aureimonas sp. ME7]|uniref:DNA cytosine methyltransferase n=1 Tax=Aureimonas sp. ME7 TaxID=2744252 RepID=UPI0015FB5895